MDKKEILDLISTGYTNEDKRYKCKVYFISNFISGLVFFIIQIILFFFKDIYALITIMILIILTGAILIVRQKELYKNIKGYFDKILGEIIIYGLICIIISSITVFLTSPSLLGVFIASIYGLIMSIDGILFKSKCRKFCGLLLIFSTLFMLLLLNYQFLILGAVQIIISFILLKCVNK